MVFSIKGSLNPLPQLLNYKKIKIEATLASSHGLGVSQVRSLSQFNGHIDIVFLEIFYGKKK